MKNEVLVMAGLLLTSIAAPAPQTVDAAGAFARLKSLAGEWQDTKTGKAHLSYELIAGGTALVERETGESMPAMLTVYHFDGGRLLLTHFCMAGNQPRMQLQAYSPQSGEMQFNFIDATNLASPAAGHMHSAAMRIVDDTHLTTEWQFFENGVRKFSEAAQYTRVR